jgi:hypothetical protein
VFRVILERVPVVLAEDAVTSEPFSSAISLLSRENTGTFRDSGLSWLSWVALTARDHWLLSFNSLRNRTGKIFGGTEN